MSIILPTDNVSAEYRAMIDGTSKTIRRRWQCIDKLNLIQALIIHRTDRDRKIYDHAFKLGVERGKSERSGDSGITPSKHGDTSTS